MAQDINDAVNNHEEMTLRVRKIDEKIVEIGRERSNFMNAQDKIRMQIKDFESFLNESRGVHDKHMVAFKHEVTKRLDDSVREVKEMMIDRRQLKAMVKNQNYHFAELQKDIGVTKSRVAVVEKTAAEVPQLIEYTQVTDTYLQNYLPTEVYAEIHRALAAAFENAPTKMRLDQIEYSQKRMYEAMEKIKQIGTLTQETFIKDEFVPLKLDFDAYSIRTQHEDEIKEALEKEQRSAPRSLDSGGPADGGYAARLRAPNASAAR